MLYGKKQTMGIIAVAIVISLLPAFAHADDLKGLVTKAITEGQSSGYLDETIVAAFSRMTRSTAPVQFMAKRARKLSEECAELEILINQPGVPLKGGGTGTEILGFKLPICLNGSYPTMLQAIDDERRKKELSECSQSIKKGVVKDGFMSAETEFRSCPKFGMVGIFYDGSCKELHPGPSAPVSEFSFDKNGSLTIPMRIPKACLAAKEKNTWQLYFFDRITPKAARVFAGKRPIAW